MSKSNEVAFTTTQIDHNILHASGIDESSLLQHFWDATNIGTESICGPFFLDKTEAHTTSEDSHPLEHMHYEETNQTNHHDSIPEPIPTASNNIDPFNHDMVGPRSCEYCGSSSTRSCNSLVDTMDKQTGLLIPKCTRPKLYFMKKRPPFDNDTEKWDPVTECTLMK
jgi:hypothetical protein